MQKDSVHSEIGKSIDNTLEKLYRKKEAPKWGFIVIVLGFFLCSIFTTKLARSQEVINLFGNKVPLAIFTGVLSALTNMCIVSLVVFYRRIGYFTAVGLLVTQFPWLLFNFVVHHNNNAIPGMFSGLFAIIVCTVIYINKTVIDKYQKRFRHQAVTDSLTELPNRFACSELMDDLIKHGINFVIVSIDLNNFKSINDTMGHNVGDKVIIEIASRWKNLADSHKTATKDFVVRLGGDEFAIIIRGYKANEDIINTINAYRAELEKTITIDNCDYFMTACFGYAKFPDDADATANLFSCSDAAMHEIKRQNLSSCILRFNSALLKKEQVLEIERKLRAALDNDSVFFCLQPQFDMSHKLRGFEALARLKDTDGTIVHPSEFIPVAEETGLIDRVDLCVFRKSAQFLAELLKKAPKNKQPDITISFNVSVRHLMRNNFIEEIETVMKETGVPANNLELEITESIMIDSAEKALQRINEVKRLGIKVAIDDFGTGYSSLSYLNKLPSDLLKIDKSFIDAMNTSESSKQYVASIVSIGHILNLKVISEGVEKQAQLETLKSIGCDYIQGYLWGQPLSPEEAAAIV